MTRVYLEQDGKRYTVSCQEHAAGSVEACAAVSCLVYTLAGWLHNAEDVQVLTERLNEADAALVFRGGKEAETAFNMICIGFLQLGKVYSEYISVEFLKI